MLHTYQDDLFSNSHSTTSRTFHSLAEKHTTSLKIQRKLSLQSASFMTIEFPEGCVFKVFKNTFRLTKEMKKFNWIRECEI